MGSGTRVRGSQLGSHRLLLKRLFLCGLAWGRLRRQRMTRYTKFGDAQRRYAEMGLCSIFVVGTPLPETAHRSLQLRFLRGAICTAMDPEPLAKACHLQN